MRSGSVGPFRVAAADGDTAVARVESLTHDARGVARVHGKATFIEGALPGEEVRFRYLKRRARFDSGGLVDVLEPSPERVMPPCRHFGTCGGCTLQHLAPHGQIEAKQRVLSETLQHLGRVRPARWLAAITGPTAGYRRRARLGVRFVPKKGGALVGFRERRRSFVTPLDACVTLDPRLSALLPALRSVAAGLSRADRLPQIEVAAGDEVCAAIFRHLEPLTPADLDRLRAFADEQATSVYLQPGGPETIQAFSPDPAPELSYSLPAFDVSFVFEPRDFIQVNSAVNRALVESAVTLLDLTPSDRVLDLFCGLGNFTLPLARRAAFVVGYEADAILVRRGMQNARRNRLNNVEFRVADLFGAAVSDVWDHGRCQKVLLDPPRAGAIEIFKALPADPPRRIVYVSCNPATLARDSEYLVNARGYRLEAVGVADMFPHTSHIESIALFART